MEINRHHESENMTWPYSRRIVNTIMSNQSVDGWVPYSRNTSQQTPTGPLIAETVNALQQEHSEDDGFDFRSAQ